MKKRWLIFGLVFIFQCILLSACADDTASSYATRTCSEEQCAQQNRVCSTPENGTCGACLNGYEEVEGECVVPAEEACEADPCQNGSCVELDEGYSCECDEGYELVTVDGLASCEARQQEEGACESQEGLCANGTCVNTDDAYTCDCDEGYAPNPDANACEDVDECAQDPNICGAGGSCVNEAGGFTCNCDGDHDLVEVNGLPSCAPSQGECEVLPGLCANGTCVNTEDGHTCDCDAGYVLNANGVCEDIDECAQDPTICGAGGICANEAGTYTCTCEPGYELNSDNICVDIDECVQDPNICGVGGTCANTSGSYSCTCAAGYELDASGVCVDIDECLDPTICGPGGTCTNTSGSYSCTCAPGYELNASGVCESTVFMMDAGTNHTCGIAQGQLFCWGDKRAKLGLGSSVSGYTYSARRVGAREDWEWIAAGDEHSCGVAGGELFCWGENGSSQLGDGTTTRRDMPQKIGSRSDWSSVTAGRHHSCGIAGGQLFCWGDGGEGQIGLGSGGSQLFKSTPTQVGSRTDWKMVSAGAEAFHTCGIAGIGYAFCWGLNFAGALGDDTLDSRYVPTAVAGGREWKQISAGEYHTCGIGKLRAVSPGGPILSSRGIGDDRLLCWGENWAGQLGDGTTENRLKPKIVSSPPSDWDRVAAGKGHTCGIADGKLYCWGYNDPNHCQLGQSGCPSGDFKTPTRIGQAYDDWQMVTAANKHACAVGSGSDYFYCWGFNIEGQLGAGHFRTEETPNPVFGPELP